jgi:branched-chain amino acid transport system substrate-binding protein
MEWAALSGYDVRISLRYLCLLGRRLGGMQMKLLHLKRSLVAVAAVMALVVGVACGNRTSDEAVKKLLAPAPGTAAGPEISASADATIDGAGAPAAASVPAGDPAASKSASSPVAHPSTSGSAAAIGRSVPAAPGGASSSPREDPSTEGEDSSAGGVAPNTGGVAPSTGGVTQKSPVILASVGTYSGPVGVVVIPPLRAFQAWVSYINDREGLNGHQVQLLVYDDGGDSARHRTQVQEAIEQRHVIAFVQNGEALTGKPSVDYITSKRVPVVGSETAEDWFYESPMYFPQASSGHQLWLLWISGVAQQMVPAGKTKLGTLFCVEVPECETADRILTDEAPRLGFQHVYQGRTSLTQPDYTAECLAARNAGAQLLLMGLDRHSEVRVANSCARQGYRPIFSSPGSAVPSEQQVKDEPNLDGFVGTTNVFPYFQSGTPATDEFGQAMRTYAPKEPLGVGLATGWVTGKLLEKAAANLPEPPTSEALLQGLWTLREDTLDGLTAPLTFVANQPAVRTTCWWIMVAKSRSWTSPDGFQRRCRQ